MNKQIASIQIRAGKDYSTGYTDLNHISNIASIHPNVANYLDRVLFASNFSSYSFADGNILGAIYGISHTEEIESLDFEWNMKAKGVPLATITNNYGIQATDKPGQYGAEIKVDVDKDFYVVGEQLGFGASDKTQMVYVINKEAKPNGCTLYLKTASEGASHYIKPKYLQPGQRLNRMFNLRGEASETGSHTEGQTNIGFKNTLNIHRKSFRVTDLAAQARIEIAIKYTDNTVEKYWDFNLVNDYRKALNKELNIQAIYGRTSDTPRLDPDSGYPINPSAGLLQQFEFGGSTEGYNVFTVDLLVHSISKMVYARMEPKDVGEITAMTGWYGALKVRDAFLAWTKNQGVVFNSSEFISRNGDYWNANSMTTGFQFTRFNLPNGGTFKLIYNPLYDDKEINSELDQDGIPLESQRITFLDVTGKFGGKSNIVLMKKKGMQGSALVEGTVKLDGSFNSDAKHMGRWVDATVMDSIGVKVIDPTIGLDLVKRVA